MSWLHVLQVECEGYVCRITLNDIEVFADWAGSKRLTQSKLNPYILEGDNRLEVALTPMTDDDGNIVEIDRVLRVALVRGEHGTDPGDAGRIAAYTHNEAETTVQPGELSSVWSRQFLVQSDQAFGRWAWQDSPAIAPTYDDAAALIALASEVHKALEARDTQTLMQLTALRDEEQARALDIPADEMRGEIEAYYANWFSDPDWSMVAFDPSALAATAHARGRLVRITDNVGGPCLRGSAGERAFAFQLFATRLNGQWRIAR
jgi:hypothetical protein